MAVEIIVAPEFSRRVRRSPLRAIANRTLRTEKVSPKAGLTLVIVGDRSIRSYNRRFHDVNAATDVLSFPAGQIDYLGDIVISFETCKRNARAVGWRIGDELELLVVHGVLHLLGYDDRTPRARARMWRRQAAILGREIMT